ncbi:vWA domain-containing protein [Corynebacterium sp. CCM 9203]|uniref:vWA domain-containing protein n=1 Tax=Corynebacterium sp. CCM 9203 TaxID=3057615 RepID=UPI00352343C7
MGRHADGHDNWRLSRELIIGLISVGVIVGVIMWWMGVRTETHRSHVTSSPPCLNGTLTLPIQAEPSPHVDELLSNYRNSAPVVRDYCIDPQIVPMETDAALTLTSSPESVTRAALNAVDRSPASDTWPIVFTQAIGVAHTGDIAVTGENWNELATQGIVIPTGTDPYTRAVMASALSGGDADKGVELLRNDHPLSVEEAVADGTPLLAVTEDLTPEGYFFYSPDDLPISTVAVPLTATDRVNEEQARAAADFARYAAEHVEQTQPTERQRQLLTTAEVISERFATVPEESRGSVDSGADTLVLLDTSGNMDELLDGHRIAGEVARLLDPLILSVGRAGGRVALWNYSSPLSPGVTKGWRDNISFLDDSAGINAAQAVKGFGTGGVPLTREAVPAALDAVSEHARETGGPVRFIIITSGSVDDISDGAFRTSLSTRTSDLVTPEVVHVGTGPVDPILAEWATSRGGNNFVSEMTVASIAEHLQNAFGVERP